MTSFSEQGDIFRYSDNIYVQFSIDSLRRNYTLVK